jgi:hypothetical protein
VREPIEERIEVVLIRSTAAILDSSDEGKSRGFLKWKFPVYANASIDINMDGNRIGLHSDWQYRAADSDGRSAIIRDLGNEHGRRNIYRTKIDSRLCDYFEDFRRTISDVLIHEACLLFRRKIDNWRDPDEGAIDMKRRLGRIRAFLGGISTDYRGLRLVLMLLRVPTATYPAQIAIMTRAQFDHTGGKNVSHKGGQTCS